MSHTKRVPLSTVHEKKAFMVDFAGFYMPLYYKSILEEHIAVRENVGLFDVSHMGRVIIKGKDTLSFTNYLTANDVYRLVDGKSHYSLLLNDRGGIVDDIFVYRISDEAVLIVYNASNRTKDINWISSHKDDFDVEISDISDNTVMFAIQGPLAPEIVSNFNSSLRELKRFQFTIFGYNTLNGWISRTGYTGEDGFELILSFNEVKDVVLFWQKLENAIQEQNGLPCGLGARDTLRLEAGYCLYGNDINDETNPFEANLGWVVKMDQKDFIGKDALEELRTDIKRIRVGLVMKDRSIPRSNYKIFSTDNLRNIGVVTSGSFSPILKRGIGMGYIDTHYSKEGNSIKIDIRGKMKEGLIKSFPLYDSSRYGFRRSVHT
jgi:aminomethyltransferase